MDDRRLIEEWLPIAEIGIEGTRERTPMTPFPAPNRLHVWWARRPLVASRAAVLGSLLPAGADRERFLHVLGIHGNPVSARTAIDRARRTGKRIDNPYGYRRAFTYSPSESDRKWMRDATGSLVTKNTIVLDQVAGGGSISFETMRLGVSTEASDINPVAVAVMQATVEWPLLPAIEDEFKIVANEWRRRVEDRLAALFPQEDAPDRLDATYLWSHTVRCPYCYGVVPLSPNWRLAPDGTGLKLVPHIGDGPGSDNRKCDFELVGSVAEQSEGTVNRGVGACPYPDCGRVVDGDEIKQQARDGEMGHQLYAVVYRKRVPRLLKSGKRGKDRWVRGYRAPRRSDDNGAEVAKLLEEKLPEWLALNMVPSERVPDGNKTSEPRRFGMPYWRDMFSPRQLLCHGSGVQVYREMLEAEDNGGALTEARKAAYGYLALALDKLRDYNSRLCVYDPSRQLIAHTFSQHAYPFKWSYAEMAPLVRDIGYDWAIRETAKCIGEIVTLIRPPIHDDSRLMFDDISGEMSRNSPPPPPRNH